MSFKRMSITIHFLKSIKLDVTARYLHINSPVFSPKSKLSECSYDDILTTLYACGSGFKV